MKKELMDFVRDLKNIKYYTIITNEGCLLHAKGNEALTLLTCLINNLRDELPRDAIEDAVKSGLESKRILDEVKELKKVLEKLGELLDE